MSGVVAAAVVAHVPTLGRDEITPDFQKTLVAGEREMGAAVRRALKPDLWVIASAHWVATFDWVVTCQPVHAGMCVADEAAVVAEPYYRVVNCAIRKLRDERLVRRDALGRRHVVASPHQDVREGRAGEEDRAAPEPLRGRVNRRPGLQALGVVRHEHARHADGAALTGRQYGEYAQSSASGNAVVLMADRATLDSVR